MNRISPLLALFALMGCNPQNAELTSGSYTMFVSKNTSTVISQEKIDFSKFENTWNIDCRILEDQELRLEDPLDICNGYNEFVGSKTRTDVGDDGQEGTEDDVYEYDSVEHEGWVNLDGFQVAHETLAPWRGEAIMTSEGDLHITFHHRLNGGEDMRFGIAVDPKFKPRRCVQTGDTVQWEDIDGDWMAEWSNQLTNELFPGSGSSGTLIPLNSGAYQFNPSPTDEADPWYFPDEWEAGYTQARWGPEIMFLRTGRFGKPFAYSNFEESGSDLNEETDLFYVNLAEGVSGNEVSAYATMMDSVQTIATETNGEVALLYPEGLDVPNYAPVVIDNGWRVSDGRNAGLDGWGELHSNWLRIDQAAADIGVGAPVSGEFRLLYKGIDSGSRLFIEGSFTVDKIKKDTWTVDELAPQKYEENETVLCGEKAYTESD
jgi:hypothetical protein